MLRGAQALLAAKRIDCIAFEFGQATFDMGNSPDEIAGLFRDHGYRLSNLVKGARLFPGGRSARTAGFRDASGPAAMIALDALALEADCPACAAPLDAEGWYMPGMRMLARARCTGCGRPYFVDLPAGQGLHSPMILDPATGAVHDPAGVAWFADWLAKSYAERTGATPAFKVDRLSPLTRPAVLINCLDTLYGHALLKLFNAQQYLDAGTYRRHRDDPAFPRRPRSGRGRGNLGGGASPARRDDLERRAGGGRSLPKAPGSAASDWRRCIRTRTRRSSRSSVSRESRPSRSLRWHSGPAKVATFIWRDDRIWSPPRADPGRARQAKAVAAFFEALREQVPDLDAAVAGLGTPGGLPGWIRGHALAAAVRKVERDWLGRYSHSHAVIGVHGSNMLLPSAHAGSVFELLADDRQGNFLQDIVFNGSDPRDLFFRYRFLPDDIAPADLARPVAFVLARISRFRPADVLRAPATTAMCGLSGIPFERAGHSGAARRRRGDDGPSRPSRARTTRAGSRPGMR